MRLQIAILDQIDYREALNLQEKLLHLRQQDKVEDIMLILQHPPTLTLGTRENRYNILLSEEQLKQQGASIYKTNRGGDVTYHGPGQIVGYPILNLKHHGKSVKGYVNKLEEVIIKLLSDEYNLTAERKGQYRGVWIGNNKIAAIGCAVKRWVTMHGFALNVNTNLEHFKWINPCGITDKGVTSLQKIMGQAQDIGKVNQQVIKHICSIFNVEPKLIDQLKLNQLVGRE